MAILRSLVQSLLLANTAAAWSVTNYYNLSTTVDTFAHKTSTELISVTPTGSVSPISQNVSTTTTQDFGNQFALYGPTYTITVTNFFLAPDASWCVQFGDTKRACPTPTIPKPSSASVTTRYFAPILIEQPSSCTKTSFSYTSSQQVFPNNLQPSSLAAEATDSAQALFITTYVVTLSTDKGGQAATTSVVDVYLSSNAIDGLLPLSQSSLLNECVDPSSSLCSTSSPLAGDFGCGPQPITYPPTGAAANGGGGGGSPTQTGTAPAASTTKPNAAPGLAGSIHWGLMAGMLSLGLLWFF
ncbi:hypothetical protein GQ53DRAFT_774001 [Thozetella sp. PMI_491]|nr:hypothetical protein GQ53DRAFT_774001 [Thozetella sp. PMI_491]